MSQDTILFQKQKEKWNIWTPQQVKDEGACRLGYVQNMVAILKAIWIKVKFF